MKEVTEGSDTQSRGICPPTTSIVAGPPPRYGTCSMFTFARCLNNSPAIWLGEPVPAVPKGIAAFDEFTLSVSSCRVDGMNEGCATCSRGVDVTSFHGFTSH